MKTETSGDIIGLKKLNLESGQEDYLRECLDAGKCWFVTRRRSEGRCIQASGETKERVSRTHAGWPGSSLVQIINGTVIWHNHTPQ